MNGVHTFHHLAKPAVDEEEVWSSEILPILLGLPSNVIDIWHYCVTEMVNNAIDHSGGQTITVAIERMADHTKVLVADDGVGIFKKIHAALGLVDEQHAILELSKGKLTTDPSRHSGQGIFFTSRMLDDFWIFSGGLVFSHKHDRPIDFLSEDDDPTSSTMVTMALSNSADRTLKDVFGQFESGEDLDFSRTVLPVRLAKFQDGKLVSRSAAKQLVARIDQFKTVMFDFASVETVGQAFLDEIFRVWAASHPEVDCYVMGESPEILRLLAQIQTPENVYI